jgi:hypothetical protein
MDLSRGRSLQQALQTLALVLQRIELLLQSQGPDTLCHGVQEVAELALGFSEPAGGVAPLLRCIPRGGLLLGIVGGNELLNPLGLHQIVPEGVQDQPLDCRAPHALGILAEAIAPASCAGEVVLTDGRERSAVVSSNGLPKPPR